MVNNVVIGNKYYFIYSWNRSIEEVLVERIECDNSFYCKIINDIGHRYLTEEVMYETHQQAKLEVDRRDELDKDNMLRDTDTIEKLFSKLYSYMYDENSNADERDIMRNRIENYFNIKVTR